jgi:fused signal recognition particle receptor
MPVEPEEATPEDEPVLTPAAAASPVQPAPAAYVVAPVVMAPERAVEPELPPSVPEAEAASEPVLDPEPVVPPRPRTKPSGPATSPGAAFNPEVVPADD